MPCEKYPPMKVAEPKAYKLHVFLPSARKIPIFIMSGHVCISRNTTLTCFSQALVWLKPLNTCLKDQQTFGMKESCLEYIHVCTCTCITDQPKTLKRDCIYKY